MNIAPTDHTIDTGRVILWQYDNATNLLNLIGALDKSKEEFITGFLDYAQRYVFDIANAGTDNDPMNGAGLNIWGTIIGIKRPMVHLPVGEGSSKTYTGDYVPISNDLYRRILMARAKLNRSSGSMEDFNEYITTIFGNNVTIGDGFNMSITYSVVGTLTDEEDALLNEKNANNEYVNRYLVFVFPMGVESNEALPPAQILGLNETADEGQNMANFAQVQGQATGGTFYSEG